MKGGNLHRARIKKFLLILLTFLFMTVLISLDRLILSSDSLISEDTIKKEDLYVLESPHLTEKTEEKKEPITEQIEATKDSKNIQIPIIKNTKSHYDETFPTIGNDEDSFSSSKNYSFHNKVCNYAKGRWIVDKRRPLYSGFKCKQWLSEMWACRLTERPDFGYEAYRWQPTNCDMPDFERSAFLKRMQDKTIAFVGDSLGRQQFQSLMCMVTGGEENLKIQDIGIEYGFGNSPGSSRPNGWAYRFPETNTTILFYWSSCLCHLDPVNPTDPNSTIAMHLDRAPLFLNQYLHNFDVLILNTGHHWNRGKLNANRWVMYIDGKPVKNRYLQMMGPAKNFTIHSITKWVDSQLPYYPRLNVFFRTISPRHFFNGEWNTGGSCENTTPLARGSEVNQEESSDRDVASAVRGTKVNLLDITALSQLRDEGHISRYSVKASSGIQDCLHWCLPGIPDTWNEILAARL